MGKVIAVNDKLEFFNDLTSNVATIDMTDALNEKIAVTKEDLEKSIDAKILSEHNTLMNPTWGLVSQMITENSVQDMLNIRHIISKENLSLIHSMSQLNHRFNHKIKIIFISIIIVFAICIGLIIGQFALIHTLYTDNENNNVAIEEIQSSQTT